MRLVPRHPALPLALAVALAASGCRELVQRGPDAESVSIAPTVIELPVNGTAPVVGTAFDGSGNTISSRTVRYSSANTAIATITEQGVVIGVSVGQTTVSASMDGKSATAQVTVVPERPSTVEVNPSPATLRRGNVRQFTAIPRNGAGSEISGRTATWASSNASIASVSPSGEVTALAPGNVIISATIDNVTGSTQVTVTEIPIGSIEIAPANRTIQVGETFQPSVTLRDTASNVISSLGRPLQWTSDNEVNASVSATGVVTGVRAGAARISAASPDNPAINAFTDVTVVDPVVKTITITPRSGSLRLSVPRQLTAQLFDSLGRQITTGRQIIWSSVTPGTVAVNATGQVTGLALGPARLAASVDEAVDTVSFQVTKIPVGEVEVSPLQSSVFQGDTVRLTATVRDSVGSEVDDRVVQWLTSDPARASVDATGLVTALTPGSATITASVEGETATGNVVVLRIPVDSVALANPADSLVTINEFAPGNTRQVSLILRDSEGRTLLDRPVQVTPSDPNIATGSWNRATSTLTVTAQGDGETSLTLQAVNDNAQPEGRITTIRVTVVPRVAVDTIALANPADTAITVNESAPGNSRQVSLIVRDADGTTLLNRDVQVVSSNPNIATATWNRSSSVLTVTGVSIGNTILELRALAPDDQLEGKTTRISVEVVTPRVSVDSIDFANPADTAVTVTAAAPGNTRLVSLILRDADGAPLLNRNLQIISSDPNVATATWNNGTSILTITGANAGTAILELRAIGPDSQLEGKTSRITVTVTP